MPAVQSIDRFVENRRARWARLAMLVETARGRAARLEADEVLELGPLYRAATSDLAIARRDYPRDAVAERLNDLVASAHVLVYSESPTSGRRLRRFVAAELPATVRASLPWTAVAFALFLAPAILTYAVGVVLPELAASTMSDELRDYLVHRAPGTEIPAGARAVAGPLIILNNVQVAIVAFAGGMTAGILTVYVLVANGTSLGTTFAVLQRYGGASALFTFVLSHGFLELSAIFLAGGAGLRLAWAILRPGERTRRDALRLASAQAMRVVLLVVVVLGAAGLIEAFVSPTTLPAVVKAGVGVATGAVLWAYIALGGSRRPATARAS
ncbi:stage II sporulation protein M [soil metagenome]